jgi:outer membrane protein TolC
MKQRYALIILPLLAGGLAAGCRGVPAAGEKSARQDVAVVARQLTPPPELKAGARLAEAVSFALRTQPQVAAAYADWAASVEQITVERSLPDPKLTFELYLADTITSLMPGLAMDVPGPGKLQARGALATAESRVKYFQFQTVVLQTALAVEKAFYSLHYLEERLRVNRQTLALLTGLETLARTQDEVGKATLQDVLRAQMEQEKLRTETVNLEDSRSALMAQFKAALGLSHDQPDPPVPAAAGLADSGTNDVLQFENALRQNPQLRELAAEIAVAEAQLAVARKDRIPDFSVGGEADVKSSPVVWNPQLSMTLPVWRDKLAAERASAQDTRHAAQARLAAGQIALAADFAEQLYDLRAAERDLTLLHDRLLPRARQALAAARTAYASGQTDFLNVIEAERALLNFQLDEIDAHTRCELARAELQLLVAGVPPGTAPQLPAQPETSNPKH